MGGALACRQSRRRSTPRQPDRDPVPVTAGGTAHAGCGTLRRYDASRWLREATPGRRHRGCASRSRGGDIAAALRGARPAEAPASARTLVGNSARRRLVPGQVTAARRGSPVAAAQERAPALLRADAQTSRPMGAPRCSTPAPRLRRPRRPLPLLCDGGRCPGMPSRLTAERAKHTHRSQPRRRHPGASSPPCENLTAATTKLSAVSLPPTSAAGANDASALCEAPHQLLGARRPPPAVCSRTAEPFPPYSGPDRRCLLVPRSTRRATPTAAATSPSPTATASPCYAEPARSPPTAGRHRRSTSSRGSRHRHTSARPAARRDPPHSDPRQHAGHLGRSRRGDQARPGTPPLEELSTSAPPAAPDRRPRPAGGGRGSDAAPRGLRPRRRDARSRAAPPKPRPPRETRLHPCSPSQQGEPCRCASGSSAHRSQ